MLYPSIHPSACLPIFGWAPKQLVPVIVIPIDRENHMLTFGKKLEQVRLLVKLSKSMTS